MMTDACSYPHIKKYEPFLLKYIPRSGKLFIDVGANIGTYSRDLAVTFKRGIAIEPDPRNLTVLKELGLENVEILPLAASDSRGILEFHQYEDTARTTIYEQVVEPVGQIQVECAPLDSLVEEAPDFIKVDTEGCELSVLMGAERLLKACPYWIVECHDFDEDGDQVYSILSNHGFSIAIEGYPLQSRIQLGDWETPTWLIAWK